MVGLLALDPKMHCTKANFHFPDLTLSSAIIISDFTVACLRVPSAFPTLYSVNFLLHSGWLLTFRFPAQCHLWASSFTCYNLQSTCAEPNTVDRLLAKEIEDGFLISSISINQEVLWEDETHYRSLFSPWCHYTKYELLHPSWGHIYSGKVFYVVITVCVVLCSVSSFSSQ